MPIHDWSRVEGGLFHHFHQRWSIALCDALNAGPLPKGYYALVEMRAAGVAPDVLTLHTAPHDDGPAPPRPTGGLAVADAPPKVRFVRQAEEDEYAARANTVVVRTAGDRVVAVIEIVSPGNKNARSAIRSFVEKTVALLRQDVSVLLVDVFPPSVRDPQGLHKLVWDEIHEEPFELPKDKPLTLASYAAGMPITAYVEPVAVGDALPDMPVFLNNRRYVPAPLEAAYKESWDRCPPEFRDKVLAASA